MADPVVVEIEAADAVSLSTAVDDDKVMIQASKLVLQPKAVSALKITPEPVEAI